MDGTTFNVIIDMARVACSGDHRIGTPGVKEIGDLITIEQLTKEIEEYEQQQEEYRLRQEFNAWRKANPTASTA